MRNKTLQAVSLVALAVGLAGTTAWAQIPGLKNQDVGFPALPGSTTFADGKYTIVGGGNDIWGNADNFHYAYITVTGDFDYIVKVESLEGPDGWTKAELMAREIDEVTFGGPDASDRHISNMTTRSAGQNEVGLQFRSDARSAGSAWPNDIGITTPTYAPTYPNTWLRLERMGSKFWGYASTDGNTWTVLRGSPYDFLALNGNEANPRVEGNMANTLALGMAVTAHNDADLVGGIGVFSDWRQMTPVPIAITTQPPAVINAAANSTLTITAAATGDPLHYQWQRNGEDIPGAMSATYTKALVQVADSGTYTVKCYGAGQTTVTSSACAVSVTVDETKPTIVEAVGSVGFTEATITFSEPVADPSATTIANYTIAGLAVSGAMLSADGFNVTLTTAKQAEGTDYTITVNNVQDTAGNAIVANTVVLFKSFSFLAGNAVMEQWADEAPVTSLASFLDARIGYVAPPTDPIPAGTTTILPSFEAPSWENGDNYAGRIFGWFMPPSTGDYVFYVCSDDASFLLLSSDETPANKRKIASDPNWDNQRSWRGSVRRDASDNGRGVEGSYSNQSDQWFNTEWGSEPDLPAGIYVISLEQGKRYYMEALWKEGGGGDGVGVNYRLATEDEATIIVDNTATRLTGALIGAYVDTSKLPPMIVTHPVNDLTLESGGTATLSVVAQNPAPGPLSYQWTRNGVDIPGATSAEYTISNAGPNDNGQYRVTVSNKNGSITSGDGNPNPTVVMVKATGVFTIEAEDFNTGGGQTKAEASVMPYLGGAYAELTAVYDIDYHNKDLYTDSQVDAHPVYRYQPGGGSDLEAGDPNDTAIDRRGVSIADNIGNQWGMTRMGEWDVTVNYKIGWVGGGDWGNYTRTFPTPAKDYYVFAAQSYDGVGGGQLNGSLGVVTAGANTTTQTVEPIGTFVAQGSGDWSRNNLVAMRDGTGELQRVELGGTQTIRWTYNSGDADYLVFIPADGGTAVGSASITLSGGNVVIAENPPGTAIVQMTTSLVGGTWTDVGAAPQTVPVTGTTVYFRLKQP